MIEQIEPEDEEEAEIADKVNAAMEAAGLTEIEMTSVATMHVISRLLAAIGPGERATVCMTALANTPSPAGETVGGADAALSLKLIGDMIEAARKAQAQCVLVAKRLREEQARNG